VPLRVKRGLRGEPGGAHEESRRSQREEVAELAARDLRLLVALVREVVLVRRSRRAHVALIRPSNVAAAVPQHALNCFTEIACAHSFIEW
jgi:hypothetical protein